MDNTSDTATSTASPDMEDELKQKLVELKQAHADWHQHMRKVDGRRKFLGPFRWGVSRELNASWRYTKLQREYTKLVAEYLASKHPDVADALSLYETAKSNYERLNDALAEADDVQLGAKENLRASIARHGVEFVWPEPTDEDK